MNTLPSRLLKDILVRAVWSHWCTDSIPSKLPGAGRWNIFLPKVLYYLALLLANFGLEYELFSQVFINCPRLRASGWLRRSFSVREQLSVKHNCSDTSVTLPFERPSWLAQVYKYSSIKVNNTRKTNHSPKVWLQSTSGRLYRWRSIEGRKGSSGETTVSLSWHLDDLYHFFRLKNKSNWLDTIEV